ncbi:MAG: hypothetical protein AAGH64_10885 [Planctomycetota bacterium]
MRSATKSLETRIEQAGSASMYESIAIAMSKVCELTPCRLPDFVHGSYDEELFLHSFKKAPRQTGTYEAREIFALVPIIASDQEFLQDYVERSGLRPDQQQMLFNIVRLRLPR